MLVTTRLIVTYGGQTSWQNGADANPIGYDPDAMATASLPPRINVFLVHGTFPEDVDAEPPPWWNEISPWSQDLKNHLSAWGIEATVERFQWTGANSEGDRRNAGENLLS